MSQQKQKTKNKMKTSNLPIAAQLISNLLKSGVNEITSSTTKDMLISLINAGSIRTGYYQGSGRHTKAVDNTAMVIVYAKKAGLIIETYNDAPRGGVAGNVVKLVDDRRKNKLVWANIAKKQAEKAAAKLEYDNRKSAEAIAAKESNQAIIDEAAFLIETAASKGEYLDGFFTSSTKLSGPEKSNFYASRMKALLEITGKEKVVTDFWKVFKMIGKLTAQKLA